jgi:uncharacterized cupredoxin-like copper-binding protein
MLVVALSVSAACRDGGTIEPTGNSTTLDVTLDEFTVAPAIETAPVGTVTFNVLNLGTIPHDFLVIRSVLPPDRLPVDEEEFTVNEDEVDVVDAARDTEPRGSTRVVVALTAGHYVLICNVPTHYESGMHAAFTVQ